MANLTIAVDDELLKRARLRTLERNTSLDALLREYLEAFSGGDRSATAARRRFTAIARAATSSSEGNRRTWPRDEIHER